MHQTVYLGGKLVNWPKSARVCSVVEIEILKKLKVKVLPAPNMAHRAAPISVSITLGHTSAKCSGSYSRGLVHW